MNKNFNPTALVQQSTKMFASLRGTFMVIGIVSVFGFLLWGIPMLVALSWNGFFVRFGAPHLDYGGACALIFYVVIVYALILGLKEVK